MNQFFYETRGKEKVKGLIREGMRNQALRRSGHAKSNLLRTLPKLALVTLGILGVLGILIR